MSDEVDLESVVEAAASGPQSTNINGTTVNQFPLKDLADIADRQAAKKAAAKNHRGLRFSKLVPPGAQ
jgi:hypothetical protein